MTSESTLQLRVNLEPTHVELTFTGRMDADEARRLAEEAEFATRGSLPVLLDLTGVSFMESYGIALVVRLAKSVMARGIPFAVAVGTGPVARLFGIARLDKVFIIAFNRAAAREVLGLPPA